MSSAAIQNAAARYNIDGTLPPLGMGKSARAERKNILDTAAAQAAASRLSPEDQCIQQIGNHSNAQSLTKLISQLASGMIII